MFSFRRLRKIIVHAGYKSYLLRLLYNIYLNFVNSLCNLEPDSNKGLQSFTIAQKKELWFTLHYRTFDCTPLKMMLCFLFIEKTDIERTCVCLGGGGEGEFASANVSPWTCSRRGRYTTGSGGRTSTESRRTSRPWTRVVFQTFCLHLWTLLSFFKTIVLT